MGLSLLIVWALTATLFSGCGGDRGPERVVVSGTVTYRGETVKLGRIRFIPSPETQAPVSGADVLDGKYETTNNGGVPVGTHDIQVVAYDVKQGQPSPHDREGRSPPARQYIPEKYNTKTQLKITISSGSGRITKNLDLDD